MPFAASMSLLAETVRAAEEVVAGVGAVARPDLALVFFSAHHVERGAELARLLTERLQPRALLGCVGESIIGNEREIEQSPALSLWVGRWNTSIEIESFHLELEQTSEG